MLGDVFFFFFCLGTIIFFSAVMWSHVVGACLCCKGTGYQRQGPTEPNGSPVVTEYLCECCGGSGDNYDKLRRDNNGPFHH